AEHQGMRRNLVASADARAMRAGVMVANGIWKQRYTVSGIVTARPFGVPVPVEMSLRIPCRKALPVPPMKAEPGVKARLYVMTEYTIVIRQATAKLVITVSPTFFFRTIPP